MSLYTHKKVPQFNLMVAGHCKSGKTDFLATLFETLQVTKYNIENDILPVSVDEIPPLLPLPGISQPTPATCSFECIAFSDSKQKISLRLIDTPGLSVPFELEKASYQNIDKLEVYAKIWAKSIANYCDKQFEDVFERETRLKRNLKKERDPQVHALLYFLEPQILLSNCGLSTMDNLALEILCKKVNVVLCLSKTDLIPLKDIRKLQAWVKADVEKQKIGIYHFDESSDNLFVQDSILSRIPFCLISSEELTPHSSANHPREMGVVIHGIKVLGRQYVWGIMQVEHDSHCDYNFLKRAMFITHLDDLIKCTSFFYEEWRTNILIQAKTTDLSGQLKDLLLNPSPPMKPQVK